MARSPPVESLLACVHACGFDIPLMLVALDRSVDAELGESLRLTPSERVARMLESLESGAKRGSAGR